MDDRIRQALLQDRVIDITTTGRLSGEPRRKEIWFHNLDGRIYITGLPGKRDWYANLIGTPSFTFHLKESVQADLKARATPIVEASTKRAVLTAILQRLDRSSEIDDWMARSPLIEVQFEDEG